MARGATFEDSQGTDFIGQQSSLMERIQRMRQSDEMQKMRREEFDMERQKFAAFLPAIIAKRDADIVGAKAAVDNVARMEQFRAKAAAHSVDYNERFQNILTIPDAQDKSDTLAAFQSEVAWMDALPEYKGFVEVVNNSRAGAFNMALTNMKLDEALERARVSAEGSLNRAVVGAGARTQVAETKAASDEKIALINADTKLSLEEKRGKIAAEREANTIYTLQARAIEADQEAANAAAVGDESAARMHRAVAANYRDATAKRTTNAGYAPSASRDASQDPRPTPPDQGPTAPRIQFNMPGSAPAEQPATPAPAGKLYVVSEDSPVPAFAPDVKTPQQVLKAVQQMTDDGVLTPEQARQVLIKLKFRPN